MEHIYRGVGVVLLVTLIIQPVFANTDNLVVDPETDTFTLLTDEATSLSLQVEEATSEETIPSEEMNVVEEMIITTPEDTVSTEIIDTVADTEAPSSEDTHDTVSEEVISVEPEATPQTPVRERIKLTDEYFTDSTEYVDDEILVKYKDSKINLETAKGRKIATQIALSTALEKVEDLREDNISLMKITDTATVEEKISELEKNPSVEFAQPNFLYTPTNSDSSITTTDIDKDLMWGLDNFGQSINGTEGTADADIDAPQAWVIDALGTTTVIVAVIDTGVAYNHPDLISSMWDGSTCVDDSGNALGGCVHGYDFQDNDTIPLPAYSELDPNVFFLAHGTHIAGIIAATHNNGTGILGVAPRAKIMAIRTSLSTLDNVKSINFAKHNGAKIINASWTGANPDDIQLKTAIQEFPGLFITAAGNTSNNNDASANPLDSAHNYPSDFDLPNIISVTATDQSDALASFSDYGAVSVDVGAPGTNIYSSVASGGLVLSENFNGLIPFDLPSGWNTAGTASNWGSWDVGGGDKVLYADLNIPYANDADSTITSGIYDMRDGEATMSFFAQCDSEYNTDAWVDYMQLEYSANGTDFFPAPDPYRDGEIFQWDEAVLDILSHGAPSSEDHVGSQAFTFNNVRIPSEYLTSDFTFRFHWTTNSTDNTYAGCFVDDITIRKFGDGTTNEYSFMQGTSMAVPHVVGLAALILGYNPSLTTAEIKDIILNSGDSIPSLSGKTVSGKRINAESALIMANPATYPPITLTDIAGSATVNSATITWKTSYPATSRVLYDFVSHSDALSTASGPANYGYANSSTESATLTTTHSVTIPNLSANTAYAFRPVSHASNAEVLGTEITVTTLTAPSGGGGGGGGGGSGKFEVKINGGASKTITRNVVLNITPVKNATKMQVSNSANFSGAQWVTFKSTYPWVLTAGNGTKTVYVRYGKSNNIVLGTVQDKITLISILGNPQPGPNVGGSTTTVATTSDIYLFTKTLKIGSKNQDVTELQRILVESGDLAKGLVTGYFGPMTARALKSFQKKHDLTETGIVDEETRTFLNSGNAPTPSVGGSSSLESLQKKLLELLEQLKNR